MSDSSCPNSNTTPTPQDLQQVQEATVCLINRERTAHGDRALIVDTRLTEAAVKHSRDMVARDYFGHVSPDGATPLQRIEASGFLPPRVGSFTVGENIAWGTLWFATPREMVRSWMQSPDHRANLLDERFRYTGVGVTAAVPRSLSNGQAGAIYTQDFAAIAHG